MGAVMRFEPGMQLPAALHDLVHLLAAQRLELGVRVVIAGPFHFFWMDSQAAAPSV